MSYNQLHMMCEQHDLNTASSSVFLKVDLSNPEIYPTYPLILHSVKSHF